MLQVPRVHIIRGNTKIGKTANVSLPPVEACVNSHLCASECYAVKFYRMWPEVTIAWDDNLKVVRADMDFYFQSIRRYLLRFRPRYFRWHVAGDILNQRYLDLMNKIATDYYFVRFVAFTKYYSLNFNAVPPNLSIVMSAWPGFPILREDFPLAFIERPDETRAKNYIKCPGHCEHCRICWKLKDIGKNVLLERH